MLSEETDSESFCGTVSVSTLQSSDSVLGIVDPGPLSAMSHPGQSGKRSQFWPLEGLIPKR